MSQATTAASGRRVERDLAGIHEVVETIEERDPNDFTACFCDADIYGCGESIPGPVEELKNHLVSQMEFLSAEGTRCELGPVLRKMIETATRLLFRRVGGPRSRQEQ